MQTNMADENLMEETGNQHLNTSTIVVAAPGLSVEEPVHEDILQEALVGSEEFDQEHVQYAVQAESDASQSVAQQINDDGHECVLDSGLAATTLRSLDSTTQIVAQSNGFGTETYRVVTTLPDGTITIPDELIAQGVAPEGTEHMDETESGVTFVDHDQQHVIEAQQVLECQQIVEGQPVLDGTNQILEGQHQILEGQQILEGHQILDSQSLVPHQQVVQEHLQTVDQNQIAEAEGVPEQQPENRSLQFALVDNGNQSAPLGSSQNPIRIVQQGNNYTPMQHLTSDQLQQIMQVLQQQQVARNTQESGGSILFNPSTNTRIVYRVIYPSELHKGQQQTVLHVSPKGTTTTTTTTTPTPTTSTPDVEAQQGDAAALPKRAYRKRGRDEEEDKVDGPEMSKEEKEERKKHRPRTRSGRVSKPPKHMVKDYKHIHVLDWNEDYDDSDGGYSDYKGSDEEGGRSKEKESSATPDFYSGLAMSASRPKNHKCHTCEKSYIGEAGLARHYRLNPSHGSLTTDIGEDGAESESNGMTPTTDNSPVLMNNGGTGTTPLTTTTTPIKFEDGVMTVAAVTPINTTNNNNNNMGSSSNNSNSNNLLAGNLSEDSNTQDSIPSSSGAISPITTRTPRGGRRGRGRGRWMYHHQSAPHRKKQKLKDLLKEVEDEVLMDEVMPRLARCCSVWEFLLEKVQNTRGNKPRADQVYQQFLALHSRVKTACQEGLRKKPDTGQGQQNGVDTDTDSQDTSISAKTSPPVVKIEDEAIAKSLGLTSGCYELKEEPPVTEFRYKYLTSDPNGPPGVSAEKRTIQVVTRDELVSQSPNKRCKGASFFQPSAAAAAPTVAVTLGSSATAASSLLTSIVSNSGLTGARPQHTLFRTVAVQQPQNTLMQTVHVQQAQNSLLQGVTVQPPPVVPSMTLPLQQPAAILRTVTVPSQPPTQAVLRTVPMSPQPPVLAQTSLLRVQPPVVGSPAAGSSKPSNGVMGVSLLNNSRSGVLSQQQQQQPPSLAVLKTSPGSQLFVAAAAPPASLMTGPSSVSEIPLSSQAAQVVSLPSSMHTAPLSFLAQPPSAMSTDFAPEDFMDNSDDSLVSSVSGLSSANSSGLVSSSAHSSAVVLPNGDMSEGGFSSVVKVNGVSSSSLSKADSLCLDNKDQITALAGDVSYIATSSVQEESDPFPVTSIMEPVCSTSTNTTSLLIKCENGELYTIASTGESVPLTSSSGSVVDSVLDSTTAGMFPATANVNGLLNGSTMEEESPIKTEDQEVMLTEVPEELIPEDPSMPDGEAEAVVGMEVEEEESEEAQSLTIDPQCIIYQTEDGLIVIQNPDGTSFRLQGVGDQVLTVEAVQSLLRVGADQSQSEVQQ